MQSTLRHPKASRPTTIFYFNPQFEAQIYSKENNFQPSEFAKYYKRSNGLYCYPIKKSSLIDLILYKIDSEKYAAMVSHHVLLLLQIQ